MSLSLYGYFRSSASYRVRIALELKQLDYEYAPLHLLKDGGEQFGEGYRRISPQPLVPLLKDNNNYFNQSLAIIEYLNETHPEPPLLPAKPADRAYVRALALDVAYEIHPLNNHRSYHRRAYGLPDCVAGVGACEMIEAVEKKRGAGSAPFSQSY